MSVCHSTHQNLQIFLKRFLMKESHFVKQINSAMQRVDCTGVTTVRKKQLMENYNPECYQIMTHANSM